MKNEEIKNNNKKEKKSFIELWKDKRERAKIELILYGVFFVGVILFARVFGSSVNNTNNDSTDNSTFLSLIDDNYEYNIVVNMNDNVYEYYGKVLGNNSTINVKVLDSVKSYYLKSDKYYVLEDENYILVNEEEVYPYIDRRYFSVNNIINYIKIGTKEDSLYKIFIILFSTCLSMTIGSIWEMLEYTVDCNMTVDMQKDNYIYEFNSILLNPKKDNEVLVIDKIGYTSIYDESGNNIITFNGYLDVGNKDTMIDLIDTFVGSLAFCVAGIVYFNDNNDKSKNRCV